MQRKKIAATNVKEIRKSDVEDFVKEILEQDGFPTQGWRRYVVFKNGYLYATSEIPEYTYVIWGSNENVIFVIESLEKYQDTICVPLEDYGLSEYAPIEDWITAYINDSFEEWNIEEYIR